MSVSPNIRRADGEFGEIEYSGLPVRAYSSDESGIPFRPGAWR